jgi:SAM-dependent methyltransferase
MAEIRGSFSSIDEWKAWRHELGEIEQIRAAILDDIRSSGFVEPFTDITRHPYQIVIRDKDLHESISSHELNSRKRALLVQIMLELQARNWLVRRNIRMLGAEAVSRIAMILRGKYPFYWGTEYLPDEAARLKYFPVPHMDLQRIDYPNECFDVFTSGDVFEHIPDLDQALKEIHRVLKPGGIIVSSFPFDPSRLATVVKASRSDTGEVVHYCEPEFHGNPVAEAQGSLVFQLPGWDLLPKLLSYGFEEAYFSMIASSHFGIASNRQLGIFILTASKPGDKPRSRSRPSDVVAKIALPKKLCTLIGLPRSGTTMLTSVFAVHSQFEAVYEPWNAKIISREAEARLEVIAKLEGLPSLAGKMLFVKETSAFEGSIPGLRKLYESTPFPVDKHMLMLLRQPEHTFLSEIERRKEWWKDDVSVNAATFDNWAEKAKLAIRLMLDFGLASNGTVLLLEDFAAQPAKLLLELAQRIGFNVEPEQLQYEKHLDKRRVRGDINVSKNPGKIDIAVAISRVEKLPGIEELISVSPHASWFNAFRSLYANIHNRGGIMSIREIPRPVIDVLHQGTSPSLSAKKPKAPRKLPSP